MGLLRQTSYVLALSYFAVISASTLHGNDSCATQSQLQALQVELIQLYVRSEEQLEAISTKLHHLTQSLDSLSWATTRVEQSVQQIESNNNVLVRNVSQLSVQTDQILVNQQYCANHEALKELFFDLTPKCAPGIIPTPPPPPIDGPNNQTYASCLDAPNRSGVYRIEPVNSNSSFQVYCEQEAHGGGWIVIQRRQNGLLHFNRSWSEYRNGFGDASAEYWLGLQHQYELTQNRNYELLIIMENATGIVYERYPRFSVNSESSYYALNLPTAGSGTAGDSLYPYRGEKFVTYDQASGSSYFSCVNKLSSGFWHYSCDNAGARNNLNGIYGRPSGDVKGIWWDHFGTGSRNSLTRVQMMIRDPVDSSTTRNYNSMDTTVPI